MPGRGCGTAPCANYSPNRWQTNRDLPELAPFCVKQGSCRDGSRRTEHFRYAHGSDGAPTLAGVDRIDIRNFHEALQAVANFLEAAAHATAYGQEARNQAAEVADLP